MKLIKTENRNEIANVIWDRTNYYVTTKISRATKIVLLNKIGYALFAVIYEVDRI